MTDETSRCRNTVDIIHRDHDGCRSGVGGSDERAPLGKKLLATNSDTALVESLAFALRVSSLTLDEYETRKDTIEDCNYLSEEYLSPATRLSILMAKDQQLRLSEKEALEPRKINRGKRHRQTRVKVLPATASPDQILRQLRTDEQELKKLGRTIDRTNGNGNGNNGGIVWEHTNIRQLHPPPMVETTSHVYPDTAKWCLSALRHLTKADNYDATATHVLIKSGIFSVIIQYITTACDSSHGEYGSGFALRLSASRVEEAQQSPTTGAGDHHYCQHDTNFLIASYGKTSARDARGEQSVSTAGDIVNDKRGNDSGSFLECNPDGNEPLKLFRPPSHSPCSWGTNSMQDAALSIVLNLCVSSKSREYVNEPHTVEMLSRIAQYPRLVGKGWKSTQSISPVHEETMNFQGLKAVSFSIEARCFQTQCGPARSLWH